jgi:azurin
MNPYVQRQNTQRLRRLADVARATVTRILAMLVLLPLLIACLTSGAAQQTVVKAVARSKPIGEAPTPVPTAALALAAKPQPTATPIPTATPKPAATPEPTATSVPTGKPVLLGTNGGEWQFDTVALEVAAGEAIALTFRNGAKTTPHNWLLISGDDYAAIEVNAAGMASGDAAGFIPDDARIIARTAGLVKGGQSETVAFTAPPTGTYVYLCTFPGHFELGMQGVLTAK